MRLPLDRHVPFYAAAVVGACALATIAFLPARLGLVVAADLFFGTYLALTLAGIGHMDADYLRNHSAESDAPVWLIFAVTVGAAAVAASALFIAVNGAETPHPVAFGLTLAAVPLGWATIHVMAAIHYAHEFWQPDEKGEKAAGLDFPGTDAPVGVDFLYFAFVLGMTAQTSDVAIESTPMRRDVLLHSIVAFVFNTVLVAAAVNVAVTLGSG